MVAASKPSTQEPMRSISWRAGCCSVPKNSGSASATRSTGICRRANHTRTAGGMRSSARMLWNIRATISMVAFSLWVLALLLQLAGALAQVDRNPLHRGVVIDDDLVHGLRPAIDARLHLGLHLHGMLARSPG